MNFEDRRLSDFSIYLDESCHLPHDNSKYMVLGFVKCETAKKNELNQKLRALKAEHGLRRNFELKWTQVSNSRLEYFMRVVDLFFSEDALEFRALVASKDGLNHEAFQQTHEDWYYKMAYQLLLPAMKYDVVLDIYFDSRDSHENKQIQNLKRILSNTPVVSWSAVQGVIQPVDSRQVELIQLADLIIGAISYANRGLATSDASIKLVEYIEQKAGKSLKSKTALGARKVNLFFWEPRR
jgi:Protein of unknown function (DUF3800)